jgi:hypothetical protein
MTIEMLLRFIAQIISYFTGVKEAATEAKMYVRPLKGFDIKVSLNVKGDLMFTLQDDQGVKVTVNPVDVKGNIAPVEASTFSVSDDTILTVIPDPADPLSATITAVGKLGTCQVKWTADPVIGAGVGVITALADVEVVAGQAVSANITMGTPFQQPPPAPPLPGA